MSDTIRVKMERAQEEATAKWSREQYQWAYEILYDAITEALTELSVLERDHEAMEKLRIASLKRGWQWRWDGLYQLEQVPVDQSIETFKDPRDAILKSGQKIGPILGSKGAA